MNNVVTIFLNLVKIDSPSGHEQKIASYLEQWLKRQKFLVKKDIAGNIVAYRGGAGKPILFSAHMDTVEPGRGIAPVIKDGIIKSSGNTILGADNKAAIAAICYAVEKYIKKEKKPRSIEILFTVKEETGGGLDFFDFKSIKSKVGFIFDVSGPLGGIVLASPYIENFHVTFYGKSAHAKNPEKGKNALIPLRRLLSNFPLGISDDGETFINVGLVSGGTGINIIPEKISISGEVRSFSKNLFKRHMDKIKASSKKYGKQMGIKVSFKCDGYCSGYSHLKKDEDIKVAERLLMNEGYKARYLKNAAISDANPLCAAGIKTINFSDGVMKPHTKEESILENNLVKLERIVGSLLDNFRGDVSH